MNEQVVFVIPLIVQAVIAKRHIADGNIERVVCKLGILVTGDLNVSIRIQLACNASADAVQFHAGELTVFKAELRRRVIDRADDRGRGVVRVQDRRTRRLVFVRSQQIL